MKNKNILLGLMYLLCIIYMIIGYIFKISNYWYESCWMFPLGMTLALNKDKIYDLINKNIIVSLLHQWLFSSLVIYRFLYSVVC